MICTIPILARHPTPARDRKIVERCESGFNILL
nr:MAG TPA: hypothetical protein [Caudoviricetes sp.]DAS72676.1 MAG TPA: hypothetical protein [Caudoviricetes sp.]